MGDDVPSNHNLHIMLVRFESKIDSLLDKHDNVILEYKKDKEENEKKFRQVNKEISSLKRYAASIAAFSSIVGVLIGSGSKYALEFLKKVT